MFISATLVFKIVILAVCAFVVFCNAVIFPLTLSLSAICAATVELMLLIDALLAFINARLDTNVLLVDVTKFVKFALLVLIRPS